ncbi:MAG: hypothetical protein IKD45_00985, partial [Clostridia bacterium]|nr:hypothetical protein [Clostridia bacterium]
MKTIEFGSYWFLENEKRPIEWLELCREGERSLLISKYALDALPYNEKKFAPATWAESSLRAFLNGEFFETAFTEEEREKICLTGNKNRDLISNIYNVSGGKFTYDKVFLLSEEDLALIESKRCRATPYAARKAQRNEGEDIIWWLRSIGSLKTMVKAVKSRDEGILGLGAHTDCIGVRPLIWVNFGKEKYECPTAEREYIEFGSYYKDNENEKLPLRWKVLKKENGEALIITSDVIDAQPYDALGKSDWSKSSLCAWLNGEFINNAFSRDEADRILSEIYIPAVDDAIALFDDRDDRVDYTVTEYARSRGAHTFSDGKCFIWLASGGNEAPNPPMMNADGGIMLLGVCANLKNGIR